MNKISYSQLSMFSECPLHWKLKYIDDLALQEPSIHLLFGTAMHEVIQTWLEVMYHDSIKNANKLNLEQRLHDKMMEQFKKDKEAYTEFWTDMVFLSIKKGDNFGPFGKLF